MTPTDRAHRTAQIMANSNNRTVYVYTDPDGEYVICFVEKAESFEGEPLTLVEVVEPAA